MSRIIIILSILFPSLLCADDNLWKWDKECIGKKGCIYFTDVAHRGASGIEYITIAIAIRDMDNKAEFISFHFPSGASSPKIVFINSQFEPREETYRSLSFKSCDEESCVARFQDGIIPGEPALDLLYEMEKSSIIWFMYEKEGKKVWALAPVGSFGEDDLSAPQ